MNMIYINRPLAIFIRKKAEERLIKKRSSKIDSGYKIIIARLFDKLRTCLSENKIYRNELVHFKQNEARLNDLVIAKDKFFSIIAHDLKNPFNSIIGFSNLLSERIQVKDYKEAEEYAKFIQTSSWRAMDLLNNLLEWARLQTGRMEFNPTSFNISSIITEVMELLNDSAIQKSLSIRTEICENSIIYADKHMINTIIRNLVSNAIKFTNPGGKILISVQQTDAESLVSVADNGIGIKSEDINKLFRIEESLSTKGTMGEEGTGLGLFLCNDFAKRNNGEIKVESIVGSGSTFILKLPVRHNENDLVKG